MRKNILQKGFGVIGVAAIVACGGCSLFKITPSPVEPQLYTQPAALSTVEVIPLTVGLNAQDLSAEIVREFKFKADTAFESKVIKMESGNSWEQMSNTAWQVVYVFQGNAYVKVNDFKMPVAVGNAIYIPSGQTVTVYNVSDDVLELLVMVPAGAGLPESPVFTQIALSDTSNYNGMCTVDIKNIEDARGFDDMELPTDVDYSAGQIPSMGNAQYILGSDPDNNPGSGTTTGGKPANLQDVQTLTGAEAAAIKEELQGTVVGK